MNITSSPPSPVNHRLARNFAILLFVAIPVAIASGAVVARSFPPVWARESLRHATPGDFFNAAAFWYILLVVPTIVVGLLHQAVLSTLPANWSRRRMRAATVGTAIGEVLLIACFMGRNQSGAIPHIFAALLPAAVAYALLAAPIRMPERVGSSAP